MTYGYSPAPAAPPAPAPAHGGRQPQHPLDVGNLDVTDAPDLGRPAAGSHLYEPHTVTVAIAGAGFVAASAPPDYWVVYIKGGTSPDGAWIRPGESAAIGYDEAWLPVGGRLRVPARGTRLGYLGGNAAALTLIAVACRGLDFDADLG